MRKDTKLTVPLMPVNISLIMAVVCVLVYRYAVKMMMKKDQFPELPMWTPGTKRVYIYMAKTHEIVNDKEVVTSDEAKEEVMKRTTGL